MASSPEQGFDSIRIAFPADAITIGQIRSREASMFRSRDFTTAKVNAVDALVLHYCEMVLAAKAFAKAASAPDPYPNWNRRNVLQMIVDGYQEYGLAKGAQSARQLVRKFEAAAADQARGRSGGRGPPAR